MVKMTMTPQKYTDHVTITCHHITKMQMIWAMGFHCRAKKMCGEKILTQYNDKYSKNQPLKMVEFLIIELLQLAIIHHDIKQFVRR